MAEFRMPTLGAAMEAGTLASWLRQPGDTVARGDVIAVVDTEKGAIEVEVFEDGIVERLLVEPGSTVPVGTPLALIRTAASSATVDSAVVAPGPSAPAVASPPAPPPPAPAPPAHPEGPPATVPALVPAAVDRPVRASPAARAYAREHGIDLARVTGTGAGAAITREDVERAMRDTHGTGPATAAAAADRMAGMRKAIAGAMALSKREIPHYYLSQTIDVHGALAWMSAWNAARPVTERLLPVALLVKAVARGLVDVPELGGTWEDGRRVPAPGLHIGIAISLRGGGLVAPAVHDVDRLDLAALMRQLEDLVRRARAGSLRSSELTDPTITVTNLGDLGVDAGYGIIHPPQVALVCVGRIAERPWVVGGKVEPRSTVTLGLSVDHRAVDGHRAGMFLAAIGRHLQEPDRL